MKMGNLEIYGVIYKITNNINGKVYIGQTINKRGFYGRYQYTGKCDIERVYKYHKKRKMDNKSYSQHLINSIGKYGFDSFEVVPVFDIAFSKEELNIKEQCWISIFDSFNNGYNKNLGGYNKGAYNITEEHRRKISEGNKGYKRSYETRKRLSEVNTGKRHTEKTKKKMSISKTGFKHSEKSKKKMSEKWALNPHNHKKVVCVETGEIFISIAEASRQKDCNRRSINNCLSGMIKTSGGYHWIYYKEYIKQQELA
ncbi:hypothetical protein CF065_19745 [Clostridium sporogenes]